MTAPTICHTMPSSIATTPRHYDAHDHRHEDAMGDTYNTPARASLELFDRDSEAEPQDCGKFSDVIGDVDYERLRSQHPKLSPIASLATQNSNIGSTAAAPAPEGLLSMPEDLSQLRLGVDSTNAQSVEVPRNSRISDSGGAAVAPTQGHSESGAKSQASSISLQPSEERADRDVRQGAAKSDSYRNLVARIRTSSSAVGDIDDLPRRLSQQLSFHKSFENAAKHL